MLKGITVVFNYATDLKAAEKFYADNFGFLVVSRDENWVEFELPGTNYALHKARADRVPGKDYSHLCFEVDDVEQTYKTLAGKGVKILEQPFEKPWGRFATIADPDGNPIMIYQKIR